MSGTPNKRLNEEGGGHFSTSKYPHDDPGMYPKLTTSSATTEYHNTHFDTVVQDARMPKIPRSEARDAERRSPLLPPPSSYRMSSSSLNDSHSEHPVASENRNELRDYKDNINSSSRDFKVDTKVEPRELYRGGKGGGVGDKDIRFDISRGDDNNKETKYAADYKVEQPNCGYNGGGGNSHFNWKELKEQQQHRGKRYPPDSIPPGGSVDLWQSSSRTTCNTTKAQQQRLQKRLRS